MTYKFLVHAKGDHVGVVIEEIRGGETVEGFILEDDTVIAVKAMQVVPLGHKISLAELADGTAVKKYGETIGKASALIQAGEHVHVHNLKSSRQS